MKVFFVIAIAGMIGLIPSQVHSQSAVQGNKHKASKKATNYYIDVHHLGAGKVTAKDVAEAHKKDLAVEKKYGVNFIKYWVDEAKGDIYCLSTAADPGMINKTHAEAHGLLPDDLYHVTSGQNAIAKSGKDFYLDIHELGAGNVTAKDVAGAHTKDLAVQDKYGVRFINYWVDEKKGIVMCLSQAPDSASIVNTHKEAHGLIPVTVEKVQQGQ